jgi:hypothetical protein
VNKAVRRNRRGPATSASISGAFVGAALVASFPAAAQDAKGIQGAWVEQSQKCEDVFVFKGGRPVFKRPVNIFAPAMIITGKRLTTPQARRGLKSAKPDGDRTAVVLQCANSISSPDVTLSLAKLPEGRLARFYDQNDQTGSRYVSCPVQ